MTITATPDSTISATEELIEPTVIDAPATTDADTTKDDGIFSRAELNSLTEHDVVEINRDMRRRLFDNLELASLRRMGHAAMTHDGEHTPLSTIAFGDAAKLEQRLTNNYMVQATHKVLKAKRIAAEKEAAKELAASA